MALEINQMLFLKTLLSLLCVIGHANGKVSGNQPRLGRVVRLGAFYDAKTDEVKPGLSLWDSEVIQMHKFSQPSTYTRSGVEIERDFEQRAKVFNLDASLKMSFLSGLVSVEGNAKYLSADKTSNNQVRVLGYASSSARTETLEVPKMRKKVQYHDLCTYKDATHIVSSVVYGVNAVFSFEKTEMDSKKHKSLEGTLKAAVKGIPGFQVEGEATAEIKEIDEKFKQSIKTTFRGDFNIQPGDRIPSTFEEAKEFMLEKIPKYLQNPTLIEFKLLPLSYFCDRTSILFHNINEQTLDKIAKVMEKMRNTKRRLQTLLQHPVAKMFRGVRDPLNMILAAVYKLENEFQAKLKVLLPRIRGSGSETELLNLLDLYQDSPVRSDKVHNFLNIREREINTIYPWIERANSHDNVIINENKHANDNKCIINKRFTVMLELYVLPLRNTANAMLRSKKTAENFEKQWFDDISFLGKSGKAFDEFIRFSQENKNRKNVCFIMQIKQQQNRKPPLLVLVEHGKRTIYANSAALQQHITNIGCLNSDGLKGYNWSHIGYYTNGYEFQGKKKTVDDCAVACKNETTCVGFTYMGHVGWCAFYKNRNDFESTALDDKGAKSYIRC